MRLDAEWASLLDRQSAALDDASSALDHYALRGFTEVEARSYFVEALQAWISLTSRAPIHVLMTYHAKAIRARQA